jgi:predicted RNase H-like nuclease (RuvC/YqgF family)
VDTASVVRELCLPVEKEELSKFINHLNQEISQLEKVREVALARSNGEQELLRERELRRKLESENRKLKRELEQLKEEKSESENYFSRDERFEMYERPDGRLDCYRRDSTSLSERLGKKVKLSPYQIFLLKNKLLLLSLHILCT